MNFQHAFFILIINLLFANKVAAEQFYFNATEVVYDLQGGKVEAKKGVSAEYCGIKLKSDTAEYNVKDEILSLEGNVIAESTEGGSCGFNYNIKCRGDFVKIAQTARTVEIKNFNGGVSSKTENAFESKEVMVNNDGSIDMQNVKFSTCGLCKTIQPCGIFDSNKLWLIDAESMTIDKDKQQMDFKNLWLKLYGMKVAYVPKMAIPTPNAKRKSGFLKPEVRVIGDLGWVLEMPYYFNIAPDKDMTFKPIITTKAGTIGTVEYRQRLANGAYTVAGSIKKTLQDERIQKNLQYLYHMDSKGELKISNNKYIGGTANFSNDPEKTYTKRYHLSEKDTLTSKLYYQSMGPGVNTLVESLYFDGLRPEDNKDNTPRIMPHVEYSRSDGLEVPLAGLVAETKLDILSVKRNIGLSYNRILISEMLHKALKLKKLALYANAGVKGVVYGDAYDSKNPGNMAYKALYGTAEVGAKHMMYKKFFGNNVAFEAKLGLMLDNKINSNDNVQPNEDGAYYSVNVHNILNSQHRYGLDRPEEGLRLGYILNANVKGRSTIKNAVLSFGAYHKLDNIIDEWSAYAVSIKLDTHDNLHLSHQMTVKSEDMKVTSSDTAIQGQFDPVGFDLNYSFLPKSVKLNKGSDKNIGELEGSLWYDVNKSWRILSKMRMQLNIGVAGDGNSMIYDGIEARYKSDCLNAKFSVGREHTKLNNLSPTNIYSLSINIPNFM